MIYKLIITDHLHFLIKEKLLAAGFEIDEFPEITNEELFKVISRYDGVIMSTKTLIDKPMLEAAGKLKFIARAGSGLDNIDVEYATTKNIRIINAPEGNANAVGEHALGLLLALTNKIVRGDRQIRQGEWEREANRGIELGGKTIGIIGYGNTGSAFASKLSGLGMRILAHDKYKSGFGNEVIIESDLATIQNEADFITLHIPHTPETHHYLNREFINGFKKSFYVVNVARGKVVDTIHLAEALESGKILGAAMDVFEVEPVGKSQGELKIAVEKLFKSDKVILTPHVAGWTVESYRRISEILAERILALGLQNVK